MMTANEQEQLAAVFETAKKEGKPWVAFDDQDGKELHALDLHFFTSATEAEKFCDDANGPDTFADQVFNWDHYVFIQAETLAARLELAELKTIWDDAADIAGQMARQSLYLPAGHDFYDLEKALSSGLVYPVLWQRSIDPLKEIADYHVIGHQHSGGQIYEIGHSLRTLETFGSLRDARIFMDSAVLFNELSDNGIDYLIIGRYHDQKLELDIEGYALPHSGLTLVTAHHNYNHGHDYHEAHSLFEPATISQYVFVGMKDGKLQLYNDKLEQTTLAANQPAFYPAHFNNDYLTLKNSNTMNESNFDYVKNQLLYLGFGEEIAKPLREKIEQNLTEFTLPHTRKFGQDETNSLLHFSKGDQKDMTFFNRFDVTLKQPGKEDLTQTFFVGQQYNYTLQERYNMMDGRFAYREQPKVAPKEVNGEVKMVPTGETYLGWKGLNFKESDRYGNFVPKTMFWNHEKELVKYPIKELNEHYDHQRLLNKLHKGDKAQVTILKDGQEIKGAIAANPRMQRFDFYDSNGQSLIVKQVEKQKLNAAEDVKQAEHKDLKQDKKETEQQNAAAEQNNEVKQGKKRGLKVA
ncbi:MAG: hypothetical protein V4577_04215 [Bacteroidota bacterium]